jgi:hypothetical protein
MTGSPARDGVFVCPSAEPAITIATAEEAIVTIAGAARHFSFVMAFHSSLSASRDAEPSAVGTLDD